LPSPTATRKIRTGTRGRQVLGPEPGYNVAPAPSAASVPAHRVARSTAATFKTKKIASRLPLSLMMPDDFADVTERIYGAIEASGTIPASDAATYCDPADAEFTRDQLYGKRAGELPNKGCFIVMRNRSYGYDANERRFSVEKDIEAMNRWAPSRSPRFEVKNHSLVRREVSGVPILSFIQDSLTDAGTARLYFLYVADGADTWAVLLASGKHDDVSAAIWDALLSGLQ
jgi:hypothetical protein